MNRFPLIMGNPYNMPMIPYDNYPQRHGRYNNINRKVNKNQKIIIKIIKILIIIILIKIMLIILINKMNLIDKIYILL